MITVTDLRKVYHQGKREVRALDGVSLTVTDVGDDWFGVSLIPTTLEVTTLGAAAPGTRVNLETDVLAKYTQRLLETAPATEDRS